MDLLLVTPKQRQYRNPVVELREKHVRTWCNDLPILNLTQSTAQLLDALQLLNQEPLDARNRYRLLELYHEPLMRIYAACDEERLRQMPVTQEQRQQLRQDIGRLPQELANGYKLVVLDTRAAQKDAAKTPWLILAVYRAIEQLGYALLHSYRCYMNAPPFALLELHQLYAWAERAGLTDTPLKLPDETSIGQRYRSLLLLTLADPFHLPDGDAERLFAVLPAWAGRCPIHPPGGDPAATGVFIIDPNRDGGPLWRPPARDDVDIMSLRELDTRPLINAVRSAAARHDAKDSASATTLETLLLPALGERNRQSMRQAGKRKTGMMIGLESLHGLLRSTLQATTGTAAMATTDAPFTFDSGASESQPDTATTTPTGGFTQNEWAVLNESMQGCRLRGTLSPGQTIRVGELVALGDAPGTRASGLRFGTIRWLQHGANGAIEAGIELIAGHPTPVECQPDGGVRRHALLFPAIDYLRLPETLLGPAKAWGSGQQLTVFLDNREATAVCLDCLEETAAYQRHSFGLHKPV